MRLFLLVSILLILFLLRLNTTSIDSLYQEPKHEVFSSEREFLAKKIDQLLPYPQSSLLSGILIGQDNIPFWLKQDLKKTGTIHMVVVSGQNLSILAGFLSGFIYILGRRKSLFIILVCLLIYSLLTGLQIPVLRALLMVFFSSLGQFFGKEGKPLLILFLTASLMLIFNPNWLFSISFQLSFLATMGVILSDILTQKIKFVPKMIRQDLAVTTLATLFTTPIIASNFGTISLVGTLVNLFLLWTIPIIMVFGFLSLILGLINIWLGQVAATVPTIFLTYFLYIVRFFGSSPFAWVSVGNWLSLVWVGYYLILGSWIWGLKKSSSKQ